MIRTTEPSDSSGITVPQIVIDWRTLGFHLAGLASDEQRALLDGFAAGLNLFTTTERAAQMFYIVDESAGAVEDLLLDLAEHVRVKRAEVAS